MTPTVLVLADDLIWSSRLSEAVRRAGGRPVARADDSADLVLVDLGGRTFDPIESIARAHGTGTRVLAVGQHEDHALRKRALDAGAERVYSYQKLFTDGPAVIARWLAA